MPPILSESFDSRRSLERIAREEQIMREKQFAEDTVGGILGYLRQQSPSRNYRAILYPGSGFVMSAGPVGLEALNSFNIVVADCGPGWFRKVFPKTIARLEYMNSGTRLPTVQIKSHDKKLLPQEKAAELMPTAGEVAQSLFFLGHRDDADMWA